MAAAERRIHLGQGLGVLPAKMSPIPTRGTALGSLWGMKAFGFPALLVWESRWKETCEELAKRKYSARDVKTDFNNCIQTVRHPKGGVKREIVIRRDSFTI